MVQVVAVCVTTQLNYLNKALDIFNTAIVSPVYYVMFTVFTIIASMVLFQDHPTQHELFAEASGFITIVSGKLQLTPFSVKPVRSTELVSIEHVFDSIVLKPGLFFCELVSELHSAVIVFLASIHTGFIQVP